MSSLSPFRFTNWRPYPTPELQQQAVGDLESGKILYFPHLTFPFSKGEAAVFDSSWGLAGHSVRYQRETGKIRGLKAELVISERVTRFMRRYDDLSLDLVHALFPDYRPNLRQIETRLERSDAQAGQSCTNKSDSGLHIDAFGNRPAGSERILRIFCNIDPTGRPRIWRIGEPFEHYARRFAHQVQPPLPGSRNLLNMLRVTKTKRSLYDHYMLTLRQLAAKDDHWQQHSRHERVEFPAGSAWMCFSDEIPHATLSGQFLLSQTFYLPLTAMRRPERSPQHTLARITDMSMVDSPGKEASPSVQAVA